MIVDDPAIILFYLDIDFALLILSDYPSRISIFNMSYEG